MAQRFTIILMFTLFVSLPIFSKNKVDTNQFSELIKISKATTVISKYYVDSVLTPQLTTSAIKGMVKSLDPHSTYLSAEDVATSKEQLSGKFVGIGVQFQFVNDTINVIHVIPNSPAEKAGLKIGDKIISVDTTNVACGNVKLKNVQSLIKGSSGSYVNLGVVRDSEPIYVKVKRGNVNISSVSESYIISKGVGYIKINLFSNQTHTQATDSLSSLKQKGASCFMIDLRSNTGGLVYPACTLLSQFLPAGVILLQNYGRDGIQDVKCSQSHNQMFIKEPLVILVDQNTASASEIVAGVLQDYDRAVIIGDTTFGKGLVQQSYPLGDGSEIRLATSRYHTPSGRSIQKPYSNGVYIKTELETSSVRELYKTVNNKRDVYSSSGIEPDVSVLSDVVPQVSDVLSICKTEGISYIKASNSIDPVISVAIDILNDNQRYNDILGNIFVP